MGLPAEIRIRIYEYALVRDVIRIVRTVHPFGTVHPCGLEKVQYCYEEPNPEKLVTLCSRRISLNNVKYSAGEVVGNEISSSYGIQPSHFPPVINLFLTSRKVYSETWPIFYQQNAFAFTTPHYTLWSAKDCLRFLYDRPYHALRHIRELHLLIGDAPQHPIRFFAGFGALAMPFGRNEQVHVRSCVGPLYPRENRRRTHVPVARPTLERVVV